MSPRKGMLGLVGVLGLAGLAAGEPPVNPLVEGREPNPVAREFHQPETPVGGYVAGPEVPEQSHPAAWLVLTCVIWDAMLDRLTFPLGTAAMTGPAEPGGV
jgi:hypothetical protein